MSRRHACSPLTDQQLALPAIALRRNEVLAEGKIIEAVDLSSDLNDAIRPI
jgi:hypothetical protein